MIDFMAQERIVDESFSLSSNVVAVDVSLAENWFSPTKAQIEIDKKENIYLYSYQRQFSMMSFWKLILNFYPFEELSRIEM